VQSGSAKRVTAARNCFSYASLFEEAGVSFSVLRFVMVSVLHEPYQKTKKTGLSPFSFYLCFGYVIEIANSQFMRLPSVEKSGKPLT
jgi:hypothetical protein